MNEHIGAGRAQGPALFVVPWMFFKHRRFGVGKLSQTRLSDITKVHHSMGSREMFSTQQVVDGVEFVRCTGSTNLRNQDRPAGVEYIIHGEHSARRLLTRRRV